MIGTRLGPYEITAKLGQGGMGEVYRATDSKLKREVAIKVLPATFTADEERLKRFEREAQMLAKLHHPHIASIFGLEESGGTSALVMELVEGPTLAERMEAGAFPVAESLAIAVQIAQALEAAHEKGIVHRDLKPQNVKAPLDGRVKVLDFGLAKAMEPPGTSSASASLAASPTMTLGATQFGVILGTAAYMAPEQAKGFAVDKRVDIWAFGVLLFEMLTGKPLFAGDSVPDTLARVLERQVDFTVLPPPSPPSIRRLLRRCLERNPRNRLHDIGDARLVLEDELAGRVDEGSVAVARPGAAGTRASRLGWAAAGLLASTLAALAVWGRPSAPRPALYRFAISAASGAVIAAGAGNSALSPDGRRVVFLGTDPQGRQGLWIQELDEVRARLLADTVGASYPFWAPDSRRVGFFAQSKLRTVSLDGKQIEVLCDAPEARGGAWSRFGTIVFAPRVNGPLVAVPEDGGTPHPVTRLEEATPTLSHRNPSFLPDGKRFVFIADPGASISEGSVFLGSLDGGASRLLYRARRAPVYAAPGFLIDAIDDRLVARPFDPETGELRGEPRRLAESTPGYVNTQDRVASVSERGAMLVPSGAALETKIVWLDRRGRRLSEIPLPAARFSGPRLSPDGRRLALVADAETNAGDIWVVDLETEQASRLTFRVGSENYPVWSPDSERIVFQSDRSGVNDLWLRDSRRGEERPLFASPVPWKAPFSWVGDTLAFSRAGGETGFDIFLLHPDRPSETPVPVLNGVATERDAAISPDGRWLAYAANDSGSSQVYVVSLPDAAVKYQVTTAGGGQPRWARNGREIVYLTPTDALGSVAVTPGDGLTFGPPSTLFPVPQATGADVVFDTSADGTRFVFIEPEGQGGQSLVVVTDWQAQLRVASGDR